MNRDLSRRVARACALGVVVTVFAALPAHAQNQVAVEKVPYRNLPNSYRLSNGTVEVIVTTDVGPRIVHYGFAGKQSVLGEVPDASKTTELGEWRPIGGHRLWAAPEAVPRTYAADNGPVAHRVDGNTIHLTAPVERGTGLQKEMVVTLASQGSEVVVLHRITNRNLWTVELAPWALTIMRGGGVGIVPQEVYEPHSDATLLPVRRVALWSYSDLSDPRFTFSRKYLRLRSDPARTAAVKIGLSNTLGWAAYHVGDSLFVKRYPYDPSATYPDLGSNTEFYTQGSFFEVETLGPLRRLEPEQTVEHVERWSLHENVDIGTTDESIERALAPIVGGSRKEGRQ